MGCVPPEPGFLEGLRRVTERHGALLIFDEVMTGFRLSRGGAQKLYNITPDLTTLGKILGGGLPIAAYGGRADIMRKIAPAGPVYQAGTLRAIRLAVTAGIAMLTYLEAHPEIYDTLETATARIVENPPEGVHVNRVGSMFTFFFCPDRFVTTKKRSTRTRRHLAGFSTTCSTTAFISRPRSSKRPSFPRRTRPKTLPNGQRHPQFRKRSCFAWKLSGAFSSPARRNALEGSSLSSSPGAVSRSRFITTGRAPKPNSCGGVRRRSDLPSRSRASGPDSRAVCGRPGTLRQLYGLVNNAARFTRFDPLDITEADWDFIHDINLKGTFFCCQEGAKQMLAEGAGRIVNISSLGGIRPWADHAITALQSRAHHVDQGSAKALAPRITVNSVAPGVIPFDNDVDARVQKMIDATPMRRAGTPEEIAEAVHFFLTASDFITGQTLAVDGGLSDR